MADQYQTEPAFERLQTKLQARFFSHAASDPAQWAIFMARLCEHFPPLLERLLRLYGARFDFFLSPGRTGGDSCGGVARAPEQN